MRVRDGQTLLTDGPFAESAEIATGFYLLSAADRDEAVKLASMIPASTVEVRQLAGRRRGCNARMVNLDGVFRREWGPAVAALARWSGDLTVAEDAVQEAFAEALRAWPRDGVPDNPGGMGADRCAQPRPRPVASRVCAPGKGIGGVVDDIRARTDRRTRTRSTTTSCG